MNKISIINLMWVIFFSLVNFSCYLSHENSLSNDDIENIEDIEDINNDTNETDTTSDCREIAPTVLDVTIEFRVYETWDCSGITVHINEVSPFCGESFLWSHEVIWLDDYTVEIIPSLYMCSQTWEECDPGATNTDDVIIYLPEVGQQYTVIVDNAAYPIICSSDDCEYRYANLINFYAGYYPDVREKRLFSLEEQINLSAEYSTGMCCSESRFDAINTSRPYSNYNSYYYTPLQACVTEPCNWDSQCLENPDSELSSFSIENNGFDDYYEIVFGESSTPRKIDVRGIITSFMLNGYSECTEPYPASIEIVTGNNYYFPTESIELTPYIRYTSEDTSCCEYLTSVAWDLINDNQIYLFAYGSLCMICSEDSCPQYQPRALSIPPNLLEPGTYTVYDELTGNELLSFEVIVGD